MENGQKRFSILERFAVVGILLVVFAMLVQNVLHSVKVSEKKSVSHAQMQYAAVRGMYSDQKQVSSRNIRATSEIDADAHAAPVR